MINIEVEVKVNGNPVQVSGKLNDLVAWFITQKLVSDDISGGVASFATQKQAKATTDKLPHKHWSDEEQAKLMNQVKTFELQGLTDSAISRQIAGEYGRTPTALNLVIYRLRRQGKLQRINPNNQNGL